MVLINGSQHLSNLGFNSDSLEMLEKAGQEKPLLIINDLLEAMKKMKEASSSGSSVQTTKLEQLIQRLLDELGFGEGMEDVIPELKTILTKLRSAKKNNVQENVAPTMLGTQHFPVNFIEPAKADSVDLQKSRSKSLNEDESPSFEKPVEQLGSTISSLTIEIMTFQQMIFTGENGEKISITQASYTRIEMHSASVKDRISKGANALVSIQKELEEMSAMLKEYAENLNEIITENREADEERFREQLMLMLAKIFEQVSTFSEMAGLETNEDDSKAVPSVKSLKEGSSSPEDMIASIREFISNIQSSAPLSDELSKAGESKDEQEKIGNAVSSQIAKVASLFLTLTDQISQLVEKQKSQGGNALTGRLDPEAKIESVEDLEKLLMLSKQEDFTDTSIQGQIQTKLNEYVKSATSQMSATQIAEFLSSISSLIDQYGISFLDIPVLEEEGADQDGVSTAPVGVSTSKVESQPFTQNFGLRDSSSESRSESRSESERSSTPVQQSTADSSQSVPLGRQEESLDQTLGSLESVLQNVVEQLFVNNMNQLGDIG